MVLDDVAEESFFFKKMAAGANADVFGHGDLHMIDVFVIPERFEDGVGKPKNEEILNGLFAEIMIDPVDLALIEIFFDLGLQRSGRGGIVTKWFFNDDARPSVMDVVHVIDEAGGMKFFNDEGKKLGLDREIKDPIAFGAKFFVEVVELLF